MKVTIARHGQSDWNVLGKWCGNSDYARLTDKGKEHAERLCEMLKDEISMIYCSELTRAKETAEPFIRYNLPVNYLSEMIEMNYGILEGTTKQERENTVYWKERKKDKLNYRIPEGESYADLIERLKPAVKKILQSSQDSVLTIGHESVNRIILGSLLEIEPQKMINIRQPNSLVYFIDTEKKTCFWKDTITKESKEGFYFINE